MSRFRKSLIKSQHSSFKDLEEQKRLEHERKIQNYKTMYLKEFRLHEQLQETKKLFKIHKSTSVPLKNLLQQLINFNDDKKTKIIKGLQFYDNLISQNHLNEEESKFYSKFTMQQSGGSQKKSKVFYQSAQRFRSHSYSSYNRKDFKPSVFISQVDSQKIKDKQYDLISQQEEIQIQIELQQHVNSELEFEFKNVSTTIEQNQLQVHIFEKFHNLMDAKFRDQEYQLFKLKQQNKLSQNNLNKVIFLLKYKFDQYQFSQTDRQFYNRKSEIFRQDKKQLQIEEDFLYNQRLKIADSEQLIIDQQKKIQDLNLKSQELIQQKRKKKNYQQMLLDLYKNIIIRQFPNQS